MEIRTIIRDYFTFNKKEQRGVFVLTSILILLVIANVVAPVVISSKPVDFKSFEKEVIEFEKAVLLADSLDKNGQTRKSPTHYSGSNAGYTDSLKKLNGKPKEIFFIDLNSCDTFDLQRLRGIGSSFAKRIVNYRARLGGFHNKEQVLEIFGMDSTRYGKIEEHLVVNRDSIKKINLNKVTMKELLFHPYFPFVLTKEIMVFRKDYKKFNDLKELRQLKIMNDSIMNKILPYVMIE